MRIPPVEEHKPIEFTDAVLYVDTYEVLPRDRRKSIKKHRWVAFAVYLDVPYLGRFNISPDYVQHTLHKGYRTRAEAEAAMRKIYNVAHRAVRERVLSEAEEEAMRAIKERSAKFHREALVSS